MPSTDFKVNLILQQLLVKYDPKQTSLSNIKKELEKSGYKLGKKSSYVFIFILITISLLIAHTTSNVNYQCLSVVIYIYCVIITYRRDSYQDIIGTLIAFVTEISSLQLSAISFFILWYALLGKLICELIKNKNMNINKRIDNCFDTQLKNNISVLNSDKNEPITDDISYYNSIKEKIGNNDVINLNNSFEIKNEKIDKINITECNESNVYMHKNAKLNTLIFEENIDQDIYYDKNSNNNWETVKINLIKTNDIIKIKNKQIIPVDGILLSGYAETDNKCLTGESEPVCYHKDEIMYAGTTNLTENILLQVVNTKNKTLQGQK
ncbi:cadmium zinc-transporting ATPase [Conglomerata obtusa]